jgi:hypothetical protein
VPSDAAEPHPSFARYEESPKMSRGIKYRKRLLRMLTKEQLLALRPPGVPADPHDSLLEGVAHTWSAKIENIVRKAVEGDIIMARAKHSLEDTQISHRAARPEGDR